MAENQRVSVILESGVVDTTNHGTDWDPFGGAPDLQVCAGHVVGDVWAEDMRCTDWVGDSFEAAWGQYASFTLDSRDLWFVVYDNDDPLDADQAAAWVTPSSLRVDFARTANAGSWTLEDGATGANRLTLSVVFPAY